jgi:hypothetical protein
MAKEGANSDRLLDGIKNLIITLSISNEYRYYILICGIFTPDRNIVKNWAQYEQVFLNLIAADGKIGIKHLFQAIVQYFIRKYPDLSKYASTFMKLMYD